MRLYIYSVYDVKAKAFTPPFYSVNEQVASRDFSHCVNDLNHKFSKNPEDYTLMCLGFFDDLEGKIQAMDNGPMTICTALSMKGDN